MPAETHRTSAQLRRSDVVATVRDVLAELLGVDDVPLSAQLGELGVDDITLLDLVEALEHDLGERTVTIALADDDLAELTTVGDVVEVLVAQTKAER